MKLVNLEDFLKWGNFFFITIGIEPYHGVQTSKSKSLTASIIFITMFLGLNLCFIGEIAYVVLAWKHRENFQAATMTMSYIGFVFVGCSKVVFVYKRKDALTKFIDSLQEIFPKTRELQVAYNLPHYLKQCTHVTLGFSVLYMILIWTFNLFAIVEYLIYDLMLKTRQVELSLPYTVYIPWNYHNHWSFFLLYAGQNVAGYTAAVGQIASDLFLVSFATLLLMHYDFVAYQLTTYQVKSGFRNGYKKDLEFLANISNYHLKLLDLSAQLNSIFGVPLLLNFATSSFVICFVGFQMTLGVTADMIFKFFLFLFSSIVQVYLICFYGQRLIDASSNISLAAYSHNWPMADTRYTKMLLFIIRRAQRPAYLKATYFVSISMETMAQIMQLSYKFFALLNTMYGKN